MKMSELEEIEAAAEAWAGKRKSNSMLFLATGCVARGVRLPQPRKFSRDKWQIGSRIMKPTWAASSKASEALLMGSVRTKSTLKRGPVRQNAQGRQR